MSRKKLLRMREIREFENVITLEREEPDRRLGKILRGEMTRVLELGCGKGDFILQYAQCNPRTLCIGTDMNGGRIWTGAVRAREVGLDNLYFVRARAELIRDYFEDGSLKEVWITFPDPLVKRRQASRRFSNRDFLERWWRKLEPGGSINVKTDNVPLFEEFVRNLSQLTSALEIQRNIYERSDERDTPVYFQTHFERRFRSRRIPISYCAAAKVEK